MMNAMDYGAFIAARYSAQHDSDVASFNDGDSCEGQDNVTEDQQQQQHHEMKADNSFSSIDGIKKENTNLLHRSKSDSNDTDEGLSMTGNSTTSLVMYANNNLNGGVPTKRSRGRPRKLNPDGSYATNHIPVRLSNNLATMQFNRRFGHEHPRNLIPEMCRLFYKKGWMPGTGGAMAIKHNKQVFITPSGVAKERILPQDLFVVNQRGELLDCPVQDKQLKLSDNTAVFLAIFTLRLAETSIHTHSKNSVLVTLAWKGNEFKISNQEMIKGLYKGDMNERYCNTDTVKIPIIENMPRESDMMNRVTVAMQLYPKINAILIRRHGLYVWGRNWQAAKAQLEALEYLFEIALEMKKLGIDPSAPPEDENGIKEDS